MLHLAQVGFFKPVISKLKASGCRIDSLVRSSGLSKFNLDDASRYVPITSLCDFLDNIERRHGDRVYLGELAGIITLDKIPDFNTLIDSSPDVLTACRLAAENADIVFTNEKAVFRIDGTRAIFGSRFFENDLKGHRHLEALNLALMVNAFRQLNHPGWNPLEIHIQHESMAGVESLLTPGHTTRVYFGHLYTGVVFPTVELTAPLAHNGRQAREASGGNGNRTRLTTKINRLLDSNRRELLPGLVQFASMADVSVRTLQRNLLEEGTTFTAIVDRWRFKRAIELLSDPGIMLKDIYRDVGYSNMSNFERAFRRWTHTSPGKYRDSLSA